MTGGAALVEHSDDDCTSLIGHQKINGIRKPSQEGPPNAFTDAGKLEGHHAEPV
jgi:hypothetical protein